MVREKNYRKICYFLGVMLNENGLRFLDEGVDFRNYTYAQFGQAILKEPGNELGKFLIVKFLIFYTVNMNFPMHIMKKLTVWLSYFKNVMDLIINSNENPPRV